MAENRLLVLLNLVTQVAELFTIAQLCPNSRTIVVIAQFNPDTATNDIENITTAGFNLIITEPNTFVIFGSFSENDIAMAKINYNWNSTT